MRKKGIVVSCWIMFFCLCFLTSGCETLRKKFTRTKKSKDSQEVMIVSPRDYSTMPFPPETLYRQYFNYWKAWQQELLTAVGDRAPHSKILDCARQARQNMAKMATYLQEDQANGLQENVEKMDKLLSDVESHVAKLPSFYNSLRYDAERVYSIVNRNYDPRKMKDYFIPQQ